MKTQVVCLLTLGLALTVSSALAQDKATAPATAPAAGGEVVPLINIEDASLPDAIRTLARQAGINFQFDPKVLESKDATGKPIPQPTISFRFERVTPMQALLAVLENHNLQLVQDAKTGIARITTKDPGAPEPLVPVIIPLKYSSPSNIIPLIQASFASGGTNRSPSRIMSDPRTGQLVILASEKELNVVSNIIAQIDRPPRQILIEARFLSTTKSPRTSKGINWGGTLEGRTVRAGLAPSKLEVLGTNSGGGIALTTSGGLVNNVGFISTDNLSAVLDFFNRDAETETLATPRIVASEGVQTELAVVRNVPIIEQQQGAQSVAGGAPVSTKPNYEITVKGTVLNEVGIKLGVVPRVYGDSNVFLVLKPEVSTKEEEPEIQQVPNSTGGSTAASAPVFNRQLFQTEAMVPSGFTLVIGGLQQDNTFRGRTKVPVLGDTPGIGALFRSNTKERRKSDILLFVTPTILAASDYQPAPHSREFLQTSPDRKAPLEWGPKDSVEPVDWSKPLDEQTGTK
jgi:type II secretory pathway component GspD/PulD (secretin)